jgi:sporulation protein YlmC with PRC-barrel domain
MVQSTSEHPCVSSNELQGTHVYSTNEVHIGDIDHLVIDKTSGRVAYAVISFGGFLGLGHSHYPLPWSVLEYDRSLGGFRTNVTEQQLTDMPAVSEDCWKDRDWETKTHEHFRSNPYWEATNIT